ncbi:hypothetical protein SAMN05216262_10816 [Colwellia chukchiensis]|uniref:Uncharacterized protein n=1 Tax=Colwellia chukchiensis TaxID=641665 RepID=A0A1H7NLC5_9GAMM|nr:hypothetical protein SAMN05216262_10816 [Colwellia chukchiensis]
MKAIGIDKAKLVFSIYGIGEHNKCTLVKSLKKLLVEVAQLQ